MNTDWSRHVQGIDTLYLSRKNRFHDCFGAQYKALFRLDEGKSLRILEIGCGPGALLEALRRWYPEADLTGLDRDSAFIAFARERLNGVRLLEGDAAQLRFEDGCFDVCISNTVSEHIEPTAFFGEQQRVLKRGGVCLVLSARKGLKATAPCLEEDAFERAFWEKAAGLDDSFEKYAVCRYPLNEAQLPAMMEKHGFEDIASGYVITDFTPDDEKYARDFARDMIVSEYRAQLESLAYAQRDMERHFDKEDFLRMRRRIDEKYGLRLDLFERGEKQWDTQVSITQIVRGRKR